MPRRALPLLLVALLALAACGDGGAPSATPSATPSLTAVVTATPTAAPTQPPALWEEFRAFAVEIEQALEADDAWFFANRGTESIHTCPGERYPTGELVYAFEPCYEKPAGTVLRGIPFFEYTRKLHLLPRDGYAAVLQGWFADPDAVALYALDFDPDVKGEAYVAIVTDTRESHRLYFEFLNGEWLLTSDQLGNLTVLPLDIYDSCERRRHYCERWEGSAP